LILALKGDEILEEKEKDWGFHAFIRGIIMFGFTMLILSLIITNKIQYYIASKMMPFIYFTLVVFFVLSVVQIIRSTPKGQVEEIECDCGTSHQMTGPRWKKILIYSIFILPLLTGFMLPEKVLDSSVAVKRGVQLSSSGANSKALLDRPVADEQEQAVTSTSRADEYLANLDKEDVEIKHFTVEDQTSWDGFDDYYVTLAEELYAQDVIYVEDDNFLDIMTVLDIYIDDFIGKRVVMKGFVYREPGVKMDELVVARFSMTCCTADSAVYGLLVKGEDTRNYENDTWIEVVGVVSDAEFNNWIIPILLVEDVYEIEEPENPYVYPNFF
jgi:putative membrane protein